MNKIERLVPSSELLKTFLVVVECENVTHAAAMLGRTQSAVSVQIRKLEDTLCVRLFERQARGMILTEDGRKLLPAASRALSEMQRVGALFAGSLRGRIRVGIPDDYNDTILERVLVDFANTHPDVEIFARSGCTSRFADAVRNNDLDVAVCSGSTAIDGDVFSSEPTVWAGGDAFSLAGDEPVPLAILDRTCWWRDMPADALDRAGRTWKIAYLSESFGSVRAAIRSGLAVGALPESNLEAGMKVLSAADGFPPLEPSQRTILVNPKAPAPLVSAMADAIRKAALHARNAVERSH